MNSNPDSSNARFALAFGIPGTAQPNRLETLADFASGRLPEAEHDDLSQALLEDPALLEMLDLHAEGIFTDPDPLPAPLWALEKVYALMPEQPSLWKVVVRLAQQGIELLQNTGELLTARPLAVRSGQAEPLDRLVSLHHLPAFDARLTLQRLADQRVTLTLAVTNSIQAAPEDLEVELYQAGQLKSARTGENGSVSFAGLKPGNYALALQVGGETVGTLECEIHA